MSSIFCTNDFYTMSLFYIKPTQAAVRRMYEQHGTFHAGAAGLDVFVPKDVVIRPGETVFIPLGIKVECKHIVSGKNVSYYLYPRSSISKTPLRMANSVGIIDAGYRGELIAAVDHIKYADNPYVVKAGTRLFQLCLPALEPQTIPFKLVETLSQSSRGEGGFGSTNH